MEGKNTNDMSKDLNDMSDGIDKLIEEGQKKLSSIQESIQNSKAPQKIVYQPPPLMPRQFPASSLPSYAMSAPGTSTQTSNQSLHYIDPQYTHQPPRMIPHEPINVIPSYSGRSGNIPQVQFQPAPHISTDNNAIAQSAITRHSDTQSGHGSGYSTYNPNYKGKNPKKNYNRYNAHHEKSGQSQNQNSGNQPPKPTKIGLADLGLPDNLNSMNITATLEVSDNVDLPIPEYEDVDYPEFHTELNRLDTFDMLNVAFPSSTVSGNLISRYAEPSFFHPTSGNERNPEYDEKRVAMILYVISSGRCIGRNIPESEYLIPTLVAELVAPCIDDSRFLRGDACNKEICENILNFMSKHLNIKYLPDLLTDQEMNCYGGQIMRFLQEGDTFNLADYLALIPDDPNRDSSPEFALAYILVNYVFKRLDISRGSIKSKKDAASLAYSSCYISLSKQGTVTEEKLQKIIQQLMDECQVNIQDLTPTVIRNTFAAIGDFIDETNAKSVFSYLSARMNNYSIRMKVTLDQSAGSSLTCYRCIIEAIQLFPTFYWPIVFSLYLEDSRNFCNAASVIGGNMYYGFSKNFSSVRSTGYKNIAYVAIKLLMRFKGAKYGALSNYKGIPKKPDREDVILPMLETFVPPQNILIPSIINDVLSTIKNIRLRIIIKLLINDIKSLTFFIYFFYITFIY